MIENEKLCKYFFLKLENKDINISDFLNQSFEQIKKDMNTSLRD
jgi:hypothetical protein